MRRDFKSGDVAQLGERGVRNAEVRGSIPLISTRIQKGDRLLFLIHNIACPLFFTLFFKFYNVFANCRVYLAFQFPLW